jgi:hypothetical protein
MKRISWLMFAGCVVLFLAGPVGGNDDEASVDPAHALLEKAIRLTAGRKGWPS